LARSLTARQRLKLRIPAADTRDVGQPPQHPSPGASTPSRTEVETRHHRVLVVDDNELNADYIRSVLKPHPFDVDVATDGPAALRIMKERRPAVVLLDIMMPGMSGMDVLEQLRRDPQARGIPVIMVTAKVQDSTMLESYQTGADYFITKPFTPRQLLHGIGLVLGIRLLD
jgi:CheY-like chemotaxis protein